MTPSQPESGESFVPAPPFPPVHRTETDPALSATRPTSPPVYEHPPRKVQGRRLRTVGLGLVENLLFGLVMLLCFGFGVVLLRQGRHSWDIAAYLVPFWIVMAYLALPRLHRVLTTIYVPAYFIGRTRTTDGMLGDPINLALLGDAAQIHATMRRAGWVEADPVTLGSSVRIVLSSLTRRSYTRAPVSPLVLFGHTQAFAYQQEVEGNPSQRHHVRFWPCPPGWLLPGGYRVGWLAAATYDRAVGLSLFTFQVTHKIDRDIDVERDYVVESVRYAVPEAHLAVIEDFSTGYHSRNGGGDAVVTDGALPVLELGGVPVPAHAAGAQAAQTDEIPSGEMLGEVGRRPVSIVLAWALVLLTAVLEIGRVVTGWKDIERDPVLAAELPRVGPLVFATYLGVVAVFYGIVLWLGWRTFRGGLLARLTMVAAISSSLVGELFQYLRGTRPPDGTLLTMSIGLLTVYALTTMSARDWTTTRHPRPRRRSVRRRSSPPTFAMRTGAGAARGAR